MNGEKKMVFSSVVFLFYFLPCVLLVYYIAGKKYRNTALLVFSLGFYYWGGPKFIVVMLYYILVNYFMGNLMSRFINNNTRKKTVLIVALIMDFGGLIYFKYTNFIVLNINKLMFTDISVKNIVLPLGISFITFQAASYIVDVYRNDAKVQKNFINLALYLAFFPHLIAGPIVRYQTVADQIESRTENIDDFAYGIERFIFGLAKKVILANQIGYLADQVFTTDMNTMTMSLAWLGAIAYTLQIYFDFSAYSDMAIGLARMFGIKFHENFNYPYIAQSVSDFWRRWHMSLTTWFRDYVYIPLGGSRKSAIITIRNVFIVWFFTGFWHGASWNFIAWGLYFFVIVTLEKNISKRIKFKIWRPIKHAYTLFFVTIGWVIFRLTSIRAIYHYVKVMFGLENWNVHNSFAFYYLGENWIMLLLCIFFSMPVYSFIKNKYTNSNMAVQKGVLIFSPVLLMFLLLFAVMFLINSTFNPFIYFRF